MARHFHGSKREERALGAYVKLMRASETVHADTTRALSRYDLSPSQFAVLEALSHVGPMVLSQLARKILKSGGNLTMVVDNLERRGLARRNHSKEDRRYIKVEATPAGRRLIREMFPSHLEKIVEVMSRLSSEEQDTLGALCRKLGLPQKTE